MWDTAELKQLESQMLEMEKSLSALRATAVAENRPVCPHTPPYLHRGVAWRLPACLHCAWRGGAGTASPGAPRAPAVHHARLESVDFTVRSSAAGPPCTHPVHMHLSCAHPVHMHAPQVIKKNCAFDSNRRGSMVIDVAPSWAAPSSPLRLPSPAWRLWAARHFQAEGPRPLGAPPLPRVLERAAS